jgi:hypothetical protein
MAGTHFAAGWTFAYDQKADLPLFDRAAISTSGVLNKRRVYSLSVFDGSASQKDQRRLGESAYFPRYGGL